MTYTPAATCRALKRPQKITFHYDELLFFLFYICKTLILEFQTLPTSAVIVIFPCLSSATQPRVQQGLPVPEDPSRDASRKEATDRKAFGPVPSGRLQASRGRLWEARTELLIGVCSACSGHRLSNFLSATPSHASSFLNCAHRVVRHHSSWARQCSEGAAVG